MIDPGLLAALFLFVHTPPTDDEKDAIQGALKRDENACQRLLNLYKGRIFSYVYRLIRHYHDAEEITFEIFIRAFRSLDSFDPRRPFSAWLFTIAHNMVIDHLRKSKPASEYLDETHPAPDDFVARYETKRKLERVEAALQLLPQVDREIVILFHKEDMSYDEIAGALNMPVTTVKTRLHRARKKLAEMVKGSKRQ